MTLLLIAFAVIGALITGALWFAMRPATLAQFAVFLASVIVLGAGTGWSYHFLGGYALESDHQFQLSHAGEIKQNVEYYREHPQELVARLKLQVESHPDQPRGWMLLGMVNAGASQFADAAASYQHVIELEPDNLVAMLNFVEADAMAHQGEWSAKDKAILTTALEKDPNNPMALNLMAALEYSLKEYAKAIAHWQQALANLPNDANQAGRDSIVSAIKKARLVSSSNSVMQIAVKCELDPSLKNRFSPNTQVLIYAKAQKGPPMPLAVLKRQLRDLPLTVTLSDDDAMIPEMTLSRFKNVTIFARVSQNGQAESQPGDAIGSVNWDGVHRTHPLYIKIKSLVS